VDGIACALSSMKHSPCTDCITNATLRDLNIGESSLFRVIVVLMRAPSVLLCVPTKPQNGRAYGMPDIRYTARGHVMPPPLHLSDVRCKYFPYRSHRGKQITLLKGAMDERTNERMKVSVAAAERYCIKLSFE